MVKTSGLPLIMVKGRFSALESMGVGELETFIPFMTKCSIQRASAQTINGIPIWWLSSIEFRFPLQKPKGLSDTGYRRHLTSIVCRCYYYHDQHYLIQFSTQVAKDPDSVVMKSNGTQKTSLYYSEGMKEILTFSNENILYDVNARREPKSPRKSLLPTSRPKVIADVYLCENCDAEFASQGAISAHERQCYGDIECESPSPDPEDLLTYLRLGKDSQSASQREDRGVLNITLTKNRFVEFSSTLGLTLLKKGAKRDVVSNPEKLVQQYDAYCNTSLSLRKPREIEYRRRRFSPQVQTSSHVYCFNKAERLERYKTLKAGLDKRSRMLLRKCKKLAVKLDRWTPPPRSPAIVITLMDCEPSSCDSAHSVSKDLKSLQDIDLVDLCSSDDES